MSIIHTAVVLCVCDRAIPIEKNKTVRQQNWTPNCATEQNYEISKHLLITTLDVIL